MRAAGDTELEPASAGHVHRLITVL